MKNKNIISSFKCAIEGIISAYKSERNIKIQIEIMLLVIIMGIILENSLIEWIIIITLFCLIIATEMINTAIEYTIDLAMPKKNDMVKKAKDISAGAVLIFVIGSSIIGLLIFVPKLIVLFN